eukprot:Ihof_evm2s18 gene=Ihof_evmTU2s18
MTDADVWGEDRTRCRQFFTEFVGVDKEGNQTKKYLDALQAIANRQNSELVIDLDDVYREYNQDFVEDIQKNTLRYVNIFGGIADEMMPEPNLEFSEDNASAEDLLLEHRKQQAIENGQELNPALFRRYELLIKPQTRTKIMCVRQLRSEYIGALVTVKGIVTRISEVKPKVVWASYTCMQCDAEIFQEAHQVPVGHTPRAMSIYARGNATRQANPGDIVEITGIYLPKIEVGFKALRQGLLASTYIDAYMIKKEKTTSAGDAGAPQIMAEVQRLRTDPDAYHMLSQSIAPEIFGHEDIKRSLLLLLAGGVGKSLSDGMVIRGDLNMLLMGDPGVAKSQLLRAICSISPRGIYTTGKGSSGVGLTAAIQKDPLTDELTLEGGALVLADQGICAIDEFDKMEDGDRTAIYEVMEQQTISIAKAGITTTLNARTSILAAANPQYGRYNIKKSVQENVNLPPALLSRFDLLFLLLDTPSLEADQRLANHVTYVHQFGKHPELGFEPIPVEVMRAYLAQAKERQPDIPSHLADYIVNHYVVARKESMEKYGVKATPRSLLALIRLSSAIARLRLADEVTEEDVDEAARLIDSSRASLETEKYQMTSNTENSVSIIYEIVMGALQLSRNHRI